MCAILDADVAHQVFGKERPPAGEAFFDWINSGGMRLVVGGKLLAELDNDARFRIWRQQASQAGRVEIFNAQRIEARTADLRNEGACRSNDLHVLALAQVSGARLLYSNDRSLHQDFGNQQLINSPRGKIYSTNAGGQLRDSHRRLLRRSDLCRGGS